VWLRGYALTLAIACAVPFSLRAFPTVELPAVAGSAAAASSSRSGRAGAVTSGAAAVAATFRTTNASPADSLASTASAAAAAAVASAAGDAAPFPFLLLGTISATLVVSSLANKTMFIAQGELLLPGIAG
jgi:hypothetical protein